MIASAVGGAQVAVLRDGTAVEVRPVRPDDGPRLLAFLSGLSVVSRYRRFFSLSPDLVSVVRSAARPDGERCFGLLALAADGVAVGHAGYWLLQPRCAEMAIAVADLYQGRGLGSLLQRRLIETARRQRIPALVMYVLPVNHEAIRLMSRSGCPLRASFRGDAIRCELLIADSPGHSLASEPTPPPELLEQSGEPGT